jgi:hypothetical protein
MYIYSLGLRLGTLLELLVPYIASVYIEPALGNPGRARCFLPCMLVLAGPGQHRLPTVAMNLKPEMSL